MRVIFKIYRVARIETRDIKAAVGLGLADSNDKADMAIRDKYGPLAYNFKIFWPSPDGFKTTIAGVEAMGFDLGEPGGTPSSAEGLVTCGPIDSKLTHRIDGALKSELERIGIWTEADDYSWRGWYEIKN